MGILIKLLQSVAGEEFAVRLFDAPIELAKELAGFRFGEKVHLTIKNVKQLVLTGGNVPLAVPQFGIEFGHHLIVARDGVTTVVLLLRYAGHVAHGALVKFSDNVILPEVTAFNLTINFVGSAVARVDANDIGQATWVGNAFGEGQLALLKQARDNVQRIGRGGGRHGGEWQGGCGGAANANGQGGGEECLFHVSLYHIPRILVLLLLLLFCFRWLCSRCCGCCVFLLVVVVVEVGKHGQGS
mmetsp:Transcript_6597/g.18482  ORF Transcript_6597/g.18482 Transcript_6597/m.18482 type:complete len:242 (-) Transcript_6597:229-954(-)